TEHAAFQIPPEGAFRKQQIWRIERGQQRMAGPPLPLQVQNVNPATRRLAARMWARISGRAHRGITQDRASALASVVILSAAVAVFGPPLSGGRKDPPLRRLAGGAAPFLSGG